MVEERQTIRGERENSPNETDHAHQARVRFSLQPQRRTRAESVSVSGTGYSERENSPASRSRIAKKSKPANQAHHTDSLWFLFLILSTLSPDKQPFHPNNNLQHTMDSKNIRTLFDPMIGEFYADTSPDVLDKFFNSKMRWRDDYAWYPQQQQTIQANMMMTEQAPTFRSSSGTNTTARQPVDPSLLDLDAIDYFWHQDIEREKGIAPVYPFSYTSTNGPSCSTSTQMCDLSEQVERDLQLLREKSHLQPLTHEESYRYENLSKTHYVDFYRTVPPVAAKRWQSASNCSSTSGYSNNTDQFLRPMSPAKSNISSFDENEAADFFSNLAKQSMMEGQQVQLQAPQQLPTYSNLTLCADQSNVLNNVSLAHQANLPGVYTNESFFNPENNGIRGSAVYKEEETDYILNEIDEIDGIAAQPLEISESEADALWTNMQNSEYLNEAVQLHEFTAMEMLGEFQPNLTTTDRIDSPIPENILTCVKREASSPSSGIGSMQSSSSSPNHNEELENEEQSYRFYDKLAPKLRHQRVSFSTDASSVDEGFKRQSSAYQRKQSKLRGGTLAERQNERQNGGAQRKRGRQSKDEQLAQDHGLPASAEEFASMTHIEIQKYMRDPKLSTFQKSLIKKIRRRGRNKIAARKCRERRTVHQDGDYYIKEELESNYDPLDVNLYEF